ncbi:MAG: glycosyltransferase family 25 protein [Akkermansiaceae bacterium]|nr:glycosyltransferase family 25 protein [Akkermansiaceae bacterium]
MKFSTYLINLDRATDRMEQMDGQLSGLGIPYTRISAVLGDLLDDPIEGLDETGFRIRTGKHRNKREVGCYFSHIKVLNAFLESDSQHALVLEDDAQLPDKLPAVLDSALDHSDKWDLLRLSSTREGEFVDVCPLVDGHKLCINTRVLKNTAAYMINRKAAERCVEKLMPMRFPYDVALDRDWDIGIRTACIFPFPVTLTEMPGQIPKAPRVKLLRATTYHLFHLADHLKRKSYRKQVIRELTS